MHGLPNDNPSRSDCAASKPSVQFGQIETAAFIAKALGGKPSGDGWLAPCPAHNDRTPSLSITPGVKQPVLVKCFAGCPFEDVREALSELGLWPEGESKGYRSFDPVEWARRRAAFEEERKRKEAEQIEVARGIWEAAKPIQRGDLADRYLREVRGFNLLQWPDCLRLGSYTSKAGTSWPALIAAATGRLGFGWQMNGFRAVQVTPLGDDARPAWSDPKRITRGVVKGASVKIASERYGHPIVLTEGVEDALAVLCIRPEFNAWAVLGVENAAAVDLPICSRVILCLDGDKAGNEGAVRAWQTLVVNGHKLSRVKLPQGVDPAKAFGGNGHA